MKKIFSLFMALILFTVAPLISGCSGNKLSLNSQKSIEDSPTIIEIWHYYNGPQKIAFDNLVSEFNETIGIEKNIIVDALNQGNVSDLTTKILDTANHKVGTGEIPDIFAAYPDTAYQIDKLGLVTDIGQYLTEEEISEYIPFYIEDGRISDDNSLKIFPIAKSIEILMLNKTDWHVFSQSTGISTDSLATMEGLTKTAQAYYEWSDNLTKKLDDGKAFFGRDAMANYLIIGSKSLGKELFSVTNGEVTIQCDEAIMRKLWDNFYVPYINGYFAAYGRFRSDDAKTGDIIALVGSSSGAAYFPSEVVVNDTKSYPIESETFPAPTFEGTEPYCIQQGAGMVVSKSNPTKEKACVEFLKWFTEEDRNISFSINSGYLPVKIKANDTAVLQKKLDNFTDVTISKNLLDSILVSTKVISSQNLYSTKAFDKGTEARNIVDTSMIDKANEDLALIKEQMAQGIPKKDAVANYDTDENFKSWFLEFQESLINTVK